MVETLQAPASAAIRAEISALRGKISKLPGKKNAKARKTINRSIRGLEGALAAAEQDQAPSIVPGSPGVVVGAGDGEDQFVVRFESGLLPSCWEGDVRTRDGGGGAALQDG